jgi:ABC-type transporter MlaC component
MFDRRLLFLLAMLFLPSGVQAASATTKAGAIEHIQLLGEQAFGAVQRSDMSLEKREAILADILSRGFALPLIARFVLGRYWRPAVTSSSLENSSSNPTPGISEALRAAVSTSSAPNLSASRTFWSRQS